MGTYTPNYNLYKPAPTDPTANFTSEYAANMDIIDQYLGGGGGGGGNVYGAFIDTNRVITSGSYSSSYSYTAAEDCYLFFTCGGTTSSSGKLYLDGNLIRYIFVNTSDNNYGDGIYLKKGQTAEVQSPQAGTFQYIVYGLTQGTDSIFTPIIYSDTERVVGVWRDNKPLYQKSFPISATAIMANTWHSISAVDVTNVETIVRTELHLGGGEESNNSWGFGRNDNGVFKVFSPVQLLVNIITIQYTKTSDVAGSGNWNTDGVPTHHYSTSEQVIGTWIDGKPLYEITVDVPNPSNDTNEHLIDLSSLSIEECPYLFGYAIRHSGSNDITYYANSIETDSWYYFKARYDNFRDSIMYTCLFRNDSISRMRFTIQYTKSTD